MNTFLQRALTILMTIIFLVAVLRVSTFSNFEEDEVEENIEKLADIDDEESFYYFQWNLNLLEIKRQKQEKTEFKTAFKNRLNYLNPYIDKILMPPELIV
jgi:hypothetical protein